MGMFAVKNDKGEWLGWEVYQDDPEFICGGGSVWTDLDKAKFYAKANGGHVVELVEAPAKAVVSEEEAKMLKNLQREILDGHTTRMTYEWISDLKDQGMTTDEIFKALDNGWEIRKDTLYNVKVPLVQAQGGLWLLINASGKLDATYIQDLAKKFSREEINTWGLQDCERKEVTDDDD